MSAPKYAGFQLALLLVTVIVAIMFIGVVIGWGLA